MEIIRAATATCAMLTLLLPAPLLAVELEKIRKITVSSASNDFAADNSAGYRAASQWYGERLRHGTGGGCRAPYIGCAEYSDGRKALHSLETNFGKSAIHRVSNSKTDGSCFIVTASPSAGSDIISAPETFNLLSAGPFLPSLKLASGLLDHGSDVSDRSGRLSSTYGEDVSPDNVRGLSVRLSPGILPLNDGESFPSDFIRGWHDDLMQTASVRSMSFWSDPGAHRSALDATRVREWSRAATVVDHLASKHGRPVGEVCNLESVRMHHVGDDLLLVEGVNHLLPDEKPPSEAKMACFMALLMQLAVKPEVLRVSPTHKAKLLNSVASAVVQSATTTETPLLDAGLDGKDEVIQVVDTGLDETSCFFADDDGLQVEHGHLFDGFRLETNGNVSIVFDNYSFAYDLSRRKVVQYIELFKKPDIDGGGDDGDGNTDDSFMYASDYLDDQDDTDYYTYLYDGASEYYYFYETWSEDSFCAEVLDDMSYHFSSFFDDSTYSTSTSSTASPSSSSPSSMYSSLSFSGGFHKDTVNGHGTWTAGSAAGSISTGAGVAGAECYGDELPGCAGGCIAGSTINENLGDGMFDLDLFCPTYECDGEGFSYSYCLGDDPVETLRQHGGVAPGAQIAVFDASYTADGGFFVAEFGGNLVWESAIGTGAKIHSNSWGFHTFCQLTENDFLYDTFMYENPDHLLIFAAGNSGGYKGIPTWEPCTVWSPALGKNVLTVGATSSGPSGGTDTGTDERLIYDRLGYTEYSIEGYPWICIAPELGAPSSSAEQADIDAIAWFSSYGPTADGRIKPEVVAPGDQVFSASSDGTEDNTCKLLAGGGTSAACPLVAGSAALVRQYFKDSSFYAKYASSMGVCDTGRESSFQCYDFEPSSATVKAMLINSANLMGGSSEPDGFRGFGRVQLDAGMPLDTAGALGLLVVDSATTSIDSYGDNTEVINIDGDADLDLRVTLAWIDPPTTVLSAVQLVNDLDLVVTAPSGATYTMWGSGASDTVNVVERVIVPAASVEGGEWTVTVSAKQLLAEQWYSLVVTGPISHSDASVQGESAATSPGSNSFRARVFYYPLLSVVLALAVYRQ